MSARTLMVALVVVAGACNGNRGSTVGSPPRTVSNSPATAASPAVPLFQQVTLERRRCFGTCPVYLVTVSGDGAVRFEGRANVDSTRGSGRLQATQLAALSRAFEDHGYFTLDSAYVSGSRGCGAYAADAPIVVTSITTASRSRRVQHDLGCSGAPRGLEQLEVRLDEILGVSRWIGKR